MIKTMRIKSDRDPGKSYAVAVEDGIAIKCECKHHIYRGATCKHMRRAELTPAFVEAVRTLIARGYTKEAALATFRLLEISEPNLEDAILRFVQLAGANMVR